MRPFFIALIVLSIAVTWAESADRARSETLAYEYGAVFEMSASCDKDMPSMTRAKAEAVVRRQHGADETAAILKRYDAARGDLEDRPCDRPALQARAVALMASLKSYLALPPVLAAPAVAETVPASTAFPCTLLRPERLTEIVGAPVDAARSGAATNQAACFYSVRGAGALGISKFGESPMAPDERWAGMKANAQRMGDVEDVAGIGVGAFFAESPGVLFFRVGDDVYTVNLAAYSGVDPPGRRQLTETVARELVTKVEASPDP